MASANTAVAEKSVGDDINTDDPKKVLKKSPNGNSESVISAKSDEIISDDAPDTIHYEGPGPLRGISKLKLETRRGQMIFEGRKARPDEKVIAIIGLRSFASYLRTIWDAAGKNDPYADWWLLRVQRIMEEKETWMDEKIIEYEAKLHQFPNMTHEVAHSISPVERDLRFSIPYSFRGAMLLMKHDQLTKTIMTANHVGMVNSNDAHMDIEKSAKAARTAFQSVTGYRFTGVTRDCVYAMNPVAQKASDLMGPCPIGILDDVVVPDFESTRSMMTRKLRQQKARAFANSKKR